ARHALRTRGNLAANDGLARTDAAAPAGLDCSRRGERHPYAAGHRRADSRVRPQSRVVLRKTAATKKNPRAAGIFLSSDFDFARSASSGARAGAQPCLRAYLSLVSL